MYNAQTANSACSNHLATNTNTHNVCMHTIINHALTDDIVLGAEGFDDRLVSVATKPLDDHLCEVHTHTVYPGYN